MNQKGFANIVLIILVVVLVGALGYVALVKKSPEPLPQSQTPSPQTQPATDNTALQPTTSASAALVVQSPNGGERWLRGKEYTIRWTSNLPTSAPIHISLKKSSTLSKDVYKEFDPKTANPQAEWFTDSVYPNPLPNSGSYTYTVPSDISPGDNWQVMIWSGKACSVWNPEKRCDFDFSDNFFSIQ